MAKPLILWFDFTSSNHPPELREQCAKFFDVSCSTRPENAIQDILRVRPKALCFDFDYPDQRRLRLMQVIKREHVSLPVLMLTLEHSEALAVWAFRARVWNYLVKPIRVREYGENLRTLARIIGAERRMTRPVAWPEPGVPNELAVRPPQDSEASLRPAIHYIEQHFNELCSAGEVAKECGMNRFRFSREFHSTLGITFQEHLLRYRIAEACRMLQRPNASVTDVGYAVGFNDASYFARIFKRYTSMLPSEYAHRDHARSAVRTNTPAALATQTGVQ